VHAHREEKHRCDHDERAHIVELLECDVLSQVVEVADGVGGHATPRQLHSTVPETDPRAHDTQYRLCIEGSLKL
jgi:hypothetical protein